MVYPPTGSTADVWEMSTSPTPHWGMAPLPLPLPTVSKHHLNQTVISQSTINLPVALLLRQLRWPHGLVVNALCLINVVTLRRAQVVLVWTGKPAQYTTNHKDQLKSSIPYGQVNQVWGNAGCVDQYQVAGNTGRRHSIVVLRLVPMKSYIHPLTLALKI